MEARRCRRSPRCRPDVLKLNLNLNLIRRQAKLKAVMDKLERLEKEFNEANDKKLQFQRDVEECAARLERAKKLIGGLGGERTRWTESCASLELSYAKLVGDALISAATIAYTGAFTPTFRKSMTDHWQTRRARGVPYVGGFTTGRLC